MTTLLSKLKKRFSRQEPPREVSFDDEGFTMLGEKEPVRASWDRVREVFAYKIDLFAYDEICIGFRFDASGAHWWVGEDYVGYRQFVDELPKRFPGIRTDWFADVAHPAFVENRTTLWGELWSPPKE